MKTLISNTFALPLLIGILAVSGLLSALLGDGLFDLLSWLALGTGVFTLVCARITVRTSRKD